MQSIIFKLHWACQLSPQRSSIERKKNQNGHIVYIRQADRYKNLIHLVWGHASVSPAVDCCLVVRAPSSFCAQCTGLWTPAAQFQFYQQLHGLASCCRVPLASWLRHLKTAAKEAAVFWPLNAAAQHSRGECPHQRACKHVGKASLSGSTKRLLDALVVCTCVHCSAPGKTRARKSTAAMAWPVVCLACTGAPFRLAAPATQAGYFPTASKSCHSGLSHCNQAWGNFPLKLQTLLSNEAILKKSIQNIDI